MKWQKNMFHTKEQDKTPEEQLCDVEIDNLPKKEFRVMIVKWSKNLGKEWIHRARSYKKFLQWIVAQSPLTLCNPMDYSPSGSSVHGLLQEYWPG